MLKIGLDNAQPGMTLALDIPHPQQPSQVLLRSGVQLTQRIVDHLRRTSVRSIWIACPNGDDDAVLLDVHILDAFKGIVDIVGKTFDELDDGPVPKFPLTQYSTAISALIDAVVNNPQAAFLAIDLFDFAARPIVRHSAVVTYLSVLMGLKLEGYLIRQRKRLHPERAREVTNLGVGAMLHDVGLTRLDAEVVERYEATGDERDVQWQEHPSLGYDMVHGKVHAVAATIVLNHHQRFNGSGYAGGGRRALGGDQIHVFSRIVGLAETFDRLVHPVDGSVRPAVAALSSLLGPIERSRFDDQVLRALLAVVPAYPSGHVVRLSDERWAVPVRYHHVDPCRPVVRVIGDPSKLDPDQPILGEEIDLSEPTRTPLSIVHFDGADTEPFNFAAPDLMAEVALM
ncbi:MAG: hypothetical protein CMJ18_14100 [Phycisphaeraceae bacterium]|nr:hypothetical protein [Phycisphaeraceae bacterium]